MGYSMAARRTPSWRWRAALIRLSVLPAWYPYIGEEKVTVPVGKLDIHRLPVKQRQEKEDNIAANIAPLVKRREGGHTGRTLERQRSGQARQYRTLAILVKYYIYRVLLSLSP